MNADCFLPQTERRCAAQAAGQEGCACDTAACQDHCRLATPRDPEAAYVYYQGSNQSRGTPPPRRAQPRRPPPAPPTTGRGKHHFGYKSKAFNVLDDRLFTYWPLPGPYAAADRNDHLQTVPGFQDLRRRFPTLDIGEVTADAGEGYDAILTYVHDDLRALRLIDQRAAKDDAAPLTCLSAAMTPRGSPSARMATAWLSTATTMPAATPNGPAANAAAGNCARTSYRPTPSLSQPSQPAKIRPSPPVPTETPPSPWAG